MAGRRPGDLSTGKNLSQVARASELGLLLLRFFITRGLGIGFGHEFSFLGLAIPASTLVIDAGAGIDPDLAAGLCRCDFGTRSSGHG